MSVDNNDKKDIKNIIAFIIIILIAIIIAFFNWAKGFKIHHNKTPEEIKTEQEIKSNIQEIKNILNYGFKNLKNINNINNNKQQEDKNNSYGYGYSYGYSDIDYNNILKNIKPEDLEQYIKDLNEIDNTFKKEE